MRTHVQIKTTDDDGNDTLMGMDVGELAQKHVLRHFNVTGDARVDEVKVLCAALIQRMLELRDGHESPAPQKRGASIAITLLEGAQMAAVKAFFAQA